MDEVRAELQLHGRRLATARANVAAITCDAKVAAERAFGAGLSERETAALLEVDRNTLRGWFGKSRAR